MWRSPILNINTKPELLCPSFQAQSLKKSFTASPSYRRNSSDVILSGKTHVRSDRANDQLITPFICTRCETRVREMTTSLVPRLRVFDSCLSSENLWAENQTKWQLATQNVTSQNSVYTLLLELIFIYTETHVWGRWWCDVLFKCSRCIISQFKYVCSVTIVLYNSLSSAFILICWGN